MNGERRLSARIPAKIIANCTRSSSGTTVKEYFISFTKDLSLKGARLVANKGIRPGEHLALGLEVPTNFIPLLAYSEVIWVKEYCMIDERKQEIIEAGIKFTHVDPSEAKKLKDFLRFKDA